MRTLVVRRDSSSSAVAKRRVPFFFPSLCARKAALAVHAPRGTALPSIAGDRAGRKAPPAYARCQAMCTPQSSEALLHPAPRARAAHVAPRQDLRSWMCRPDASSLGARLLGSEVASKESAHVFHCT